MWVFKYCVVKKRLEAAKEFEKKYNMSSSMRNIEIHKYYCHEFLCGSQDMLVKITNKQDRINYIQMLHKLLDTFTKENS